MALWRGGAGNVTYALQGGCVVLAGRSSTTLAALPKNSHKQEDVNDSTSSSADLLEFNPISGTSVEAFKGIVAQTGSWQNVRMAGTPSCQAQAGYLGPQMPDVAPATNRPRQAPCALVSGALRNQIAALGLATAAAAASAVESGGICGAPLLAGCVARSAGTSLGNRHSGVCTHAQVVPAGLSAHSIRNLHGMVSVMTAAEAARDLLSAIKQPVSYPKLAANLSKLYSVELFDALSGLVLSHLDELSGLELSNLLWACATVGHKDSSLASSIVESLQGRLSEMGTLELANALWALSRLRVYDAQFVTAASERVWDALPAATPRQLAAILQAYAWFRQQDPQLEEDEDLMRSIATKFRAQVRAASATEIALVLSSMARLRRADELLLNDACAALERGAPKAGLQVLAEAAWACAILQHLDTKLMEAVAERVAEALRVAAGLLPAPPAVAAGVSSSLPVPLRPKTGAKGGASGPGSVQSQAAAAQRTPAESRRAQEPQSPPPMPESVMPPSVPTCFSALWPTQVGPGGHISPYTLYDRFNPSLPDGWHSSHHGGLSFGVLTGIVLSSIGAADTSSSAAAADAAALVDADVVSKLLWSFGVLQCYDGAFYTLLFRQLPRLHYDRASWSSLARLMGAQIKSYELQHGQGYPRVNPLEADSANAWARFQRTRVPAHKLPDHFLPAAFVASHAEADGRDHSWADGVARPSAPDLTQPQMPGQPLSRLALQQEVVSVLRAMGVQLRASATIDGLFHLEHTTMINGLSICLEVLAAGCCTLDAPYRPMGPAAARLQSLQFRGWMPLVVPFHEWDALAAEDRPPAMAQVAAAEARKQYLRRKLEDLIGEELPPLPLKTGKRRGP